MIQPLTLIVLHTRPYKESSLLVYAYTNVYGRQNYVLKGIRRPEHKAQVALFHPLSILEAQAYNNPKKDLQYLKEYHRKIPLDNLCSDVRKNAIALFMGELIYKCIKEIEEHPALFSFLESSVLDLENATEQLPNTHLLFATRLSRYLGYEPQCNYSEQTPFFNIPLAKFTALPDTTPGGFTKESSLILHTFLQDSDNSNNPACSGEKRYEFLKNLLQYFDYHMEKPLGLHSPDVLHHIFSV